MLFRSSKEANGRKSDRLAPLEDRDRWLVRNDESFEVLTSPAPRGLGALAEDRDIARTVATWIYRRHRGEVA